MAAWIPDGYTERGFIEPVENLHEGLRFRYRPMLIEDGSEFIDSVARLKPREAERKTAAMLAKQLIDWELRSPSTGEQVEKSPASILKLKRVVFQRLTQIVLGMQPSDTDPEWPAENQDEHIDRKTDVTADGRPIGAVAEDRDTKN